MCKSSAPANETQLLCLGVFICFLHCSFKLVCCSLQCKREGKDYGEGTTRKAGFYGVHCTALRYFEKVVRGPSLGQQLTAQPREMLFSCQTVEIWASLPAETKRDTKPLPNHPPQILCSFQYVGPRGASNLFLAYRPPDAHQTRCRRLQEIPHLQTGARICFSSTLTGSLHLNYFHTTTGSMPKPRGTM